jgi:hypothetical protein
MRSAIEVVVERERRGRKGSYCMQAVSDAMLDMSVYMSVIREKIKKKKGAVTSGQEGKRAFN